MCIIDSMNEGRTYIMMVQSIGKRSGAMYLELKKDIRTLLIDTAVFQNDLEMTKRECSIRFREYKENKSAEITDHMKKLESDLIITGLDLHKTSPCSPLYKGFEGCLTIGSAS